MSNRSGKHKKGRRENSKRRFLINFSDIKLRFARQLNKKRKWSDLVLIIMTILFAFGIIFTVSHFSRSIVMCGDGKCDAGECSSCLKDCKFGECSDGTCQLELGENCLNSKECACPGGQECDVRSEKADSKGCFLTMSNVFVNVQDVEEGISVSTLYANKDLNDGLNNHGLMTFVVQNLGEAGLSDVALNPQIQNYVSEMIVIGDLKEGEIKKISWNPNFGDNILKETEDKKLDVNIRLTYSEESGQKHTLSEETVIGVLGRNKIGKYGSYKDYVTPENSAVKNLISSIPTQEYNTKNDMIIAATKAWDKIRELNIEVSADRIGYVQYPEETISRRSGDGEDIAVLYASLLKNIDIRPAVVITTDKVFGGFYDKTNILYPVNTKAVGKPFNYAWTTGFEDYSESLREKDVNVKEI